MAKLTTSEDIGAFLASADNAAARTNLGSGMTGDEVFRATTPAVAARTHVHLPDSWSLNPPSLAGTIGSGSTASAVNVIGAQLASGTSAGAAASFGFSSIMWSRTATTGQSFPINAKFSMLANGCVFMFTDEASAQKIRFDCGVSEIPVTSDADPLAGHGFGVEFYMVGTSLTGRLYWRAAGAMVYGTAFTLASAWTAAVNGAHTLGHMMLTHDGAGNIAFYASPQPTSSSRGVKQLPATPTATIGATFSSITGAGRHLRISAANHSSTVPTAGCIFVAKAIYTNTNE